MEYQEYFLYAFLSSRLPRRLQLLERVLNIEKRLGPWSIGSTLTIDLACIDDIELLNPHKNKSVLAITYLQSRKKYDINIIVSNADDKKILANQLTTSVQKRLAKSAQAWETKLKTFSNSCDAFFEKERYIRGSELQYWQAQQDWTVLQSALRALNALYQRPIFTSKCRSLTLVHWKKQYDDLCSTHPNARFLYNQRFIGSQRQQYADIFEKIESNPLNPEQIEAALAFDDANLCIAAAGSGKTSVIVAKVAYAVKSGLFAANEVLALAFNTKAADELQNRLSEKISLVLGEKTHIEARTFHGMGNYFLGSPPDGKRWQVYPLDEEIGKRHFYGVYDELVNNNSVFRDRLFKWIAFYRYPELDLSGGSENLEENEKRYHTLCKKQIRKKIEGKLNPWEPMIPTLKKGLMVRSLEEAAIANWLLLHKISFDYEFKKFDWGKEMGFTPSASGNTRPYLPDFSYRHPTDEKRRIYHEHFGLNKDGKAPDFLGGETYEKNAAKKIEFFQEKFSWLEEKEGKPIPFFDTRSFQFRDGHIFEYLHDKLTEFGIPVNEKDEDLESAALHGFRQESDLEFLFIKFIQLYRDSGLTFPELR